jgi:hypothetical protein
VSIFRAIAIVAEVNIPVKRQFTGLVDLGLLVPAPSGCGGGTATQQAPSSTDVKLTKPNLVASLPGSGWTKTEDSFEDSQCALVMYEHNGAGLQFIAIDGGTWENLVSLRTLVQTGAGCEILLPVCMVETEDHSYNAERTEGAADAEATSNEADDCQLDYRYIGYASIVGGKYYLVAAGGAIANWEDGGQEQVQAILDSVKFGQ